MARRATRTVRTMRIGTVVMLLAATGAFVIAGRAADQPTARIAPPSAMVPQDLGPEAFGVLPAIRPQDGNGLDFGQRGGPPNLLSPVIDYSGRHEQIRYVIDATPILPDSAPVIRPDAPLPTEQTVRDFATRLGMTGSLGIQRQGGKWDYTIGALDPATGAQATLGSRGTFGYSAPDPGARCGEATATPFRYPPSTLFTPPPGVAWTAAAGIPSVTGTPAVPATPTATPFGVGSELCNTRGAALDEATAAAVAQDFLARAGVLPDASYTMQVLPPNARTPTVRPVRWTAAAPNGGRYIGREAARDIGVLVGPNRNVTNAGGPLPGAGASSRYRLRSPADLAATLQAGEAYVTLALPLTDGGFPAFTFGGNQPLAVHITGAELGYSLAYTFDAQPYLLPVVIYTGTATTNDSLAIGKEIGFAAYVDAVMHPAPQPVSVAPAVPLPATPDLASLTSYTFTESSLSRADFDALTASLGFDNTAAKIETSPIPFVGGGDRISAKYADGSSFAVNLSLRGDWQYDNGGKINPGPNAPRTPPDVALAVVQQFVTIHHVNLRYVGTPTATQPAIRPETFICYPLLLDSRPVIGLYGGTPECGLRAFVDSGGQRFSLYAQALLVSLQRGGTAGLQAIPATGNSATAAGLQPAYPAGSSIVTARNALDALAIGPEPIPIDADLSAPGNQLARLYIEDEPENAPRHLVNIFTATRGQAAPNQFTADQVALAYVSISVPTGKAGQRAIALQPVWLIAGQIDIGNRHRIAPFTYLYPAVR